jgi:hypothetical protein
MAARAAAALPELEAWAAAALPELEARPAAPQAPPAALRVAVGLAA